MPPRRRRRPARVLVTNKRWKVLASRVRPPQGHGFHYNAALGYFGMRPNQQNKFRTLQNAFRRRRAVGRVNYKRAMNAVLGRSLNADMARRIGGYL